MSYLKRINAIEADASRNYHNFSGDVEMYGYTGGNMEELDANDRTLTIKISNANTITAKVARVFGASKDLNDALLDPDITILVDESSHTSVKAELLQNPFRIGGLKYVVSDALQLNNSFSIIESTSTGSETRKKWQPINYRSAMNQITTQIDAPSFDLLVSANTYIEVLINPSSSVTMTVTLSQKAAMRNVLQNRQVATTSFRPAPTGTFDKPAIAALKERM